MAFGLLGSIVLAYLLQARGLDEARAQYEKNNVKGKVTVDDLASTYKLQSGRDMPRFGLGTWKSDKGLVTKAVEEALVLGYRHVDAASIYLNQDEVGLGIRKAIARGVVKREEIWVTSKIWMNMFHDPQLAVERILKELQLDYVDQILLHWPVAWVHTTECCPSDKPCSAQGCDYVSPYGDMLKPRKEDGSIMEDFGFDKIVHAWKGLEELVRSRKVRSIGVSNFREEELEELLKVAQIPIDVNQVEIQPFWQQQELQEYCLKRSILLVAYSPLGNPTKKPDDGSPNPMPMENPVIKELAQFHEKSPAQIILRWLYQRQIFIIPKSTTPKRIKENSEIFDFELSDDEMDQMRALMSEKTAARMFNPDFRANRGVIFPKEAKKEEL